MNTREPHPDTGSDDTDLHGQAERLGRRFTDSAQQIWLAGLGAFSRAQAEGSRLFESLVREGESAEARRREQSEDNASLRDTVEQTFDQARERATGTWERMEQSFEDQMQRVLRRMDIPSRRDIEALNERLDALNQRLNRAETRASASPGQQEP